MVVAATLNVSTLNNSYYVSDKGNLTYDNELWVRYAQSVGMIGENEITIENQSDEISYIECIRYIAKAKQKILSKDLDKDSIPNFKDYEGYNNEQQLALADLVQNGIIDNSKKRLNGNKVLTKSKLNELIVKYVVKYNLLTLDDDKINIKDEKKPSNDKQFPYTLIGVDKSIYEISFINKNEKFQTPIELFSKLKYSYKKINTSITDYLNCIYNVDYNNFDDTKFKRNMYEYSKHYIDNEKLNNYCEYIKSNKIKISGEVKLILPVIYFDGENYRARVKIKYNVENADTFSNLVFGDSDNTENSIYSLGEKTIYVDVPFSSDSNLKYFYIVSSNSISNSIVKE